MGRATVTQAAPTGTEPQPVTHREVVEALTGLLLAMFVAMLSSTVVSNALPRIVTDLEGSQTGYTWVVVATLLTLSHRMGDETRAGLERLGVSTNVASGGQIPDLATLPEPVRVVVEHAFGVATGQVFLVATPVVALALLCVLFIREVLRTTMAHAREEVTS